MEKEPIISKWHKGKEVEDTKIAEGFFSGETGKRMGVRRKVFETTEGKKFYVYKEAIDLQEAKNSMAIYRIFQRADLPVVDFAKIIKSKVEDRDEFMMAMEDLTENGRLAVIELNEGLDPPVSTRELVRRSDIPLEIKERMVRALAVIHNNDIYDFHPGISFVIRAEEPREDEIKAIDFKIIDYANFYTKAQKEAAESKGELLKESFVEVCSQDLRALLRGIASNPGEKQYLEGFYWAGREGNKRFFE